MLQPWYILLFMVTVEKFSVDNTLVYIRRQGKQNIGATLMLEQVPLQLHKDSQTISILELQSMLFCLQHRNCCV